MGIDKRKYLFQKSKMQDCMGAFLPFFLISFIICSSIVYSYMLLFTLVGQLPLKQVEWYQATVLSSRVKTIQLFIKFTY